MTLNDGVQPVTLSPTTMLGRRIVDGQPAVVDERLRLELGLLVGVAKALADVALLLAHAAAALARDVRRRDVHDALQRTARAGLRSEPQHRARAADVDPAGVLELLVEADRRRAVRDRGDLARQAVARRRREAEVAPLEIARHRTHAPARGGQVGRREQGLEYASKARLGLAVVRRPDDRHDLAIAALDQADEQLAADEAGGAGDEDRTAAHDRGPLISGTSPCPFRPRPHETRFPHLGRSPAGALANP